MDEYNTYLVEIDDAAAVSLTWQELVDRMRIEAAAAVAGMSDPTSISDCKSDWQRVEARYGFFGACSLPEEAELQIEFAKAYFEAAARALGREKAVA